MTGRVVDQADLLRPSDEADIAHGFADLERTTGHQVVVVTVTSLGGKSIDEYAQSLGNYWRIGRKGIDDGVLLVVAPKERRVRIAIGEGLRRTLTDAEAASIIAQDILPSFKTGDMRTGIHKGATKIMSQLAAPSGAKA